MNALLKFLSDNQMYFVFGVLLLFSIMEALFGYFGQSKRSKNDVLTESVNTFILMAITKPIIYLSAYKLMSLCLPSLKNIYAGLPFWLMMVIALFIDDLVQYWYHRASHEYKWLWKWHRPHHVATEMGFLVSYREAMWFYVFMPNLWFMAILTFLGMGIGVAAGVVLKQIVVIATHSFITWDKPFYSNPKLKPIILVIERILITPAFHHGHHAVSIIDDIGNPNGNFGNMFSFWDQLFGSAKFAHAYPKEYGIPNDPNDPWQAHIFYPVLASDKKGSEISRDYKFEKTTSLEPSIINLKVGDYLYCKCGYSKTQPFCDGSHHGTKKQPEKFSIKREGDYKLCNCKLNKRGPFCDNSHLKA